MPMLPMFDRFIAQSAYHNAMRANGGTFGSHEASIDGISRSEAMRLARKQATEIFGHGWLATASIGRTLNYAAALCEAIATECRGNHYADAYTGMWLCQCCSKEPQFEGYDHLCIDCYRAASEPAKPSKSHGYFRPTKEEIQAYATEYRTHGASCGHHTRMTFGVMPTREDFDRAFDAVCSDTDRFEFGNDPFIGDDALTASQLWAQLEAQLATWNEGEHASHCPGSGECDGSDDCHSEQAGSWCSSVLGILGFEWI